MQYVGQAGQSIKTRFHKPFCKMKTPKKMTDFYIAISKILVIHLVKLKFSQLEKLYMIVIHQLDKNIRRNETELKWIKIMQSHFPLDFNDNIYHEGNISKMPDFDVFSLL